MSAESVSASEVDKLPLNRGYLFTADGSGHWIDSAKAAEWLKGRDGTSGEFLWLHFQDISALLASCPVELMGLPQGLVDKLGEGSRTTRIEQIHQHLVAVVNDVDYDIDRKASIEVATLWSAVDARCLLSVRSLPLRSVNALRRVVESGQIFRGPMALLIRLLQEQADVLARIVRNASQTTNEVDIALREGKLRTRAGLGGIRRDLARLRHLLAPEPAAIF